MIDRLFSLAGRRALVTGSSRGIGRTIALGLAAAGARVAFHGASRSPALRSAVVETDGQHAAIAAELGTRDGVASLVAQVEETIGNLDILVLNASIEMRESWDSISDEAFAQQVAVNLNASRRLIQAFAPGMAARGWGRVLAIGSVQEVREHPQMLIYASLKAAQTSMMRNLARQLSGRGVTFNTLAPGAIATDRNSGVLADQAYRAAVENRIPASRIGVPEDCVGAALLLCSEAGRYITGERLFVDGGMHLP